MNDPWDVKSVRQSNQYESCMKINGVPLLPPVLSKECRKEMQYYKLLAKEVEKRISILKPYVENDSDSDKTDAPELPECEQYFDETAVVPKLCKRIADVAETDTQLTDVFNKIKSNVTVQRKENGVEDSTKFIIDLNLSINETSRSIVDTISASPRCPSPVELPERDYNCSPKQEKELLMDIETVRNDKHKDILHELENLQIGLDKEGTSDAFLERPFNQDGPSSLSSKSFTGSLHDIHAQSSKESQIPKLIRQRSYTLLTPSPQLLAHLEVQSMSTGVEVNAISMSESLSNLTMPNKKRRSWDLETAKVKWSSMALELKTTNLVTIKKPVESLATGHASNRSTRSFVKKPSPPCRSNSAAPNRARRHSVTSKSPKSDPVQKPKMLTPSKTIPSEKAISKHSISPSIRTSKEPTSPTHRTSHSPKHSPKSPASPKHTIVSNAEDPATKVRELYEKIQKQQLVQMASLVEKQKREQLLLQQVFEEQNNVLYKQLKTICPKSPIEIKQAWGDKEDSDRGPVSLSHIINQTSVNSVPNSPISHTLKETHHRIHHCNEVLEASRTLTGNLKHQPRCRSLNDTNVSPTEGSKTRTHSPSHRNASRKLNYDTSSDREYEGMLTDRTNDTMADLNVTFPSDTEDNRSTYTSQMVANRVKELAKEHRVNQTKPGTSYRSTDSAIRSLEDSIQNSINAMAGRSARQSVFHRPPTTQERVAASTIVAYARGYLVRRLMRTERVETTVQTIRDALLCALQLHTERDGIRGPDVDLHRRLIQQITAACYSLHDTFVTSSPADRCALIAADRARRRAIAARQPTPRAYRQPDI